MDKIVAEMVNVVEQTKGGNEMNELVAVDNNQVITSSRQVAEKFGKRHDNTMRDIEVVLKDLGDTLRSEDTYFYKSEYKDTMNRSQEEYLMNKDGFTLLAMGFTGKKAMKFKIEYINKFNEMEEYIEKQMMEKHTPSYQIENPIERAKAWIVEQEEVAELKLLTGSQEQIINELQPKADYTDEILKSKDTITITQIAKDYGLSGQAMNKILNDLKVQYKQSGQWMLYRGIQDKGYTKSETVRYNRGNGTVGTAMNTKWTNKGRLYLYNLLKEEGILPIIEQE